LFENGFTLIDLLFRTYLIESMVRSFPPSCWALRNEKRENQANPLAENRGLADDASPPGLSRRRITIFSQKCDAAQFRIPVTRILFFHPCQLSIFIQSRHIASASRLRNIRFCIPTGGNCPESLRWNLSKVQPICPMIWVRLFQWVIGNFYSIMAVSINSHVQLAAADKSPRSRLYRISRLLARLR
jgi:hypothetical protein